MLLHRCYYSGLEFICDVLCRVDFHSCGQCLQCMLIYCNKRIFYMRKESWGRFVEFPDSYFACSRRSDRRAREKNSRRKKNKGRLEPPPVFPVYNLTRSPTPYYLNAWNRLIVTGPGKLLPFTFKIEVSFSSFADNMMKLYRSTKQNGLVCRQGPMPSFFKF